MPFNALPVARKYRGSKGAEPPLPDRDVKRCVGWLTSLRKSSNLAARDPNGCTKVSCHNRVDVGLPG